jgi:ubiquitin carboxyl-terminal hydrolase 36/42
VPSEFLSTVPRLSRQFQIGRQADAHELLRFLIDKVESKDFKQVVFAGELQSTVKCKECRYESMVNEVFLDLSLEVSSNTIEKCLSDFCREEVLTGENKYNCPSCKKKTNASKQYLIKSSPNVLTIQLKRFTNLGKKETRTVGFCEKLVLSKELITEEKVNYSLYAVLIHIGFGCRSGHYYCFVKASNEVWYEVNDSSVSQASVSRVLSHNGAYILMYKRDVPRTKPFENSFSDGKNFEKITKNVENDEKKNKDRQNDKKFEIGKKHFGHPSSPAQPVKKFKPSSQNFPVHWKKNSLSLGFIKDEYDASLDKGKQKKKKRHRNNLNSSIWDRAEIKA